MNDATMPAALDAEQSILGAILLDNLCMEQTAHLKADDFHGEGHQWIFRAMAELSEEKQPIDIVTLTDSLNRRGSLFTAGGVAYIASLTDGVPRRPSIENYVRIVREKSALRQIILASHNTILRAQEPGADGDKLAIEFRSKLGKIAEEFNASVSEGTRDIGEYGTDYYAKMNQLRAQDGEVVGMTYGVRCLDKATTGMRLGENTVVGGRPGSGKSSFALTVAIANAKKGVRVYYRSDEMGGETVYGRTLSNLASVNNFLLRNPRKLTFSDLQFLQAARDETATLPLIIDEKPGLHIETILKRAKHLVRTRGVQLCIFDYIQIIHADGKDKNERVGSVAEAIAGFAREMNVHCMMLSQLSRPDKKVKDYEPTLSDLRESGRIEDNADVVILLHRGEKEDVAIIPKQRNGPIAREEILFEAATLTYRDK